METSTNEMDGTASDKPASGLDSIEASKRFHARIVPVVMSLRAQGLSTTQIGREMERRGIPAYQGRTRWGRAQVSRVVLRGLLAEIVQLQGEGLSAERIAGAMDRRGIRAPSQSKQWSADQVRAVLLHAGGQSDPADVNRARAQTITANARAFAAPLVPVVIELRQQGLSPQMIGEELGRRGIRTRTGSLRWDACVIGRIIVRGLLPIATAMADRGCSLTEIGAELDKLRVHGKSGRDPWHPHHVARLLARRTPAAATAPTPEPATDGARAP